MQGILNNQKNKYLIVLFISTILIFTNFSFISFVLLIWLLSRYLPQISKSKFNKFIWTYVFFSIAVISIYSISWIFNLSIKFYIILAMLDLLAIFLVLKNKIKIEKINKIDYSNYINIVVSISIMLFVSLPVLTHPSPENVLRQASKTQDDINHAAMIEADRSVNGFLFTSNIKADKFVNIGMNAYPQGYHINGAFFESQFIKLLGKDNLKNRIICFYVFRALWLGIASFLTCELLVTISNFFFGLKRNKLVNINLGVAGLSLSGYLLIPLFGYGFQSFIGELVFLTAGLIILVKYFESSKLRPVYLLVASVFGTALGLTWILPAPILILPVISLAIIDYKKWKFIKNSSLKRLFIYLGTILFSLMSLISVYAQLHFSSQSISNINAGGAAPPIYWISVVLVWIAIYLTGFKLNLIKKYRQFFVVIGVVPLEFITFAIYQQIKFNFQFYYSIKFTFLAALVGLAILIPILFKIASDRFNSKLFVTFGLISLIIILPIFLRLNIKKSLYPLKGKSPIGYSAAHAVLQIPTGGRELIILTKNSEESYLSTKTYADYWVFGSDKEKNIISELDDGIYYSNIWLGINEPGGVDNSIAVIRP